jgi:hypothetical protein
VQWARTGAPRRLDHAQAARSARPDYSKARDATRILRGKDLSDTAKKCPELKAFLNTILALSGAEPLYGDHPPIEYIGRGGATNFAELISWPIHFLRTVSRIVAAISSSGAPLRSRPFTSVSSIANKQ